MIDNSYKTAYENILKENTLLHAQKNQIKDAAVKAIAHADEVIQKLNNVIDSICGDAIDLVRELPDTFERRTIERNIALLAPLKVQANGTEKVDAKTD